LGLDDIRQFNIGIDQQGGQIVLNGAETPTLEVDKVNLLVLYHNVARLHVPVHETGV